jgi:hypothetical protein
MKQERHENAGAVLARAAMDQQPLFARRPAPRTSTLMITGWNELRKTFNA